MVSTDGKVTPLFGDYQNNQIELRCASCFSLAIPLKWKSHFNLPWNQRMIWKLTVAILAVFALRILVRRFKDPDTDWD
jgi:hypothetical protein